MKTPDGSSNSRRSVWCQRSIFLVVVGENGLVNRVVIPFSRQTRSNKTSAGRGRVNHPVNCFSLSVNTSDGTPWIRIALRNASATARPDGTANTVAITTKLE